MCVKTPGLLQNICLPHSKDSTLKKSDILHKPVCVSWGTRSFLMSVVVRSAYLRTTSIWPTGCWRHVTQDLHLVVRRGTALVLLAAEAECNTLDISNHYLCSMHVLLNFSCKKTELLHLPKCAVCKIKSNWPTDHLSANIRKACMLILQFKHVSFEPRLCLGTRKAGRIWHHDLTELFYWDCNLTADMLIFKTLFEASCVGICSCTNKNLQFSFFFWMDRLF